MFRILDCMVSYAHSIPPTILLLLTLAGGIATFILDTFQIIPLLVFEAIFETRGVLMEKETELGMYSKQWFNITDYEVFSGSKQDRIFKSPMAYFNSKLPFFKKSSSSLYKYKSLNKNLSQVHLMCVVKCWIIFCSNWRKMPEEQAHGRTCVEGLFPAVVKLEEEEIYTITLVFLCCSIIKYYLVFCLWHYIPVDRI